MGAGEVYDQGGRGGEFLGADAAGEGSAALGFGLAGAEETLSLGSIGGGRCFSVSLEVSFEGFQRFECFEASFAAVRVLFAVVFGYERD